MASNGFQTAFKELGLDKIMGVINSVLSSIKPIVSVLSSLMKMLTLAISPIFDLVVVLLFPVLLLLKPLVMAFNQFLRPFIQLSVEAMRKAASAGVETSKGQELLATGSAVLIGGIALLLETIFFQSILTALRLFLSIATVAINAFTFGAFSNSVNFMATSINDFMEETLTNIVFKQIEAIGKQAAKVGLDSSTFVKDAQNTVGEILTGKEGLGTENAKQMKEQELIHLALMNHFRAITAVKIMNKSNELKSKGVSAVNKIIADARAEAARIIAAAKGKGKSERPNLSNIGAAL